MAESLTRRAVVGSACGLAASAFAPAGLRLSTHTKRDLWRRATGPHLRGAVFVQRRVYPDLDGPSFLGSGPFGPPITDQALDQLAEQGANLASWSGPGLFAERAPFAIDAAVEDHIGSWLDRCRTRGLYTTLCLRSGPGRSAVAFHPGEDWYPAELYDDSIWRSDEKQAAWVDMVLAMLERFGSHPALAGLVPMEEPNGADLGFRDVWPRLASAVAERASPSQAGTTAPLLFSPDRWARLDAVPRLRSAIGSSHPLVLHDYEPWDFTHQSENTPVTFDPLSMASDGFEGLGGDWSVLEFGAVRHARGVDRYLEDRIASWERLGANWAAFRWTSGWRDYERAEGAMSLGDDNRLRTLLRRAFAKNRLRPD